MHEKSHHNHFPIASRRQYTKNFITITSQLLPRRKCMKDLITNCSSDFIHEKSHHNHYPIASRRKYTKNFITIASQSLPRRKCMKNLITITSQLLPDENTQKISSQLLPNRFPDKNA